MQWCLMVSPCRRTTGLASRFDSRPISTARSLRRLELSNLSLNRQIVDLLSTGLGIAIVEGGRTLESVRATSDESERLSAELDRMIEEVGEQQAKLVKMLQQAEEQRATLDEMIAEEKRRLDELKGSA